MTARSQSLLDVFLRISEGTCALVDGDTLGGEVLLVRLSKASEKPKVRIVAVHRAKAQIATSIGMK
jgi:hypothetical protein